MSGVGEPVYLEGLNPVQREAVLHFGRPLLILAGAGSGKTRVITVKIAHLLSSLGMGPRDILAVTFTNKAAGEMRERAVGLSALAEGVLIRTFHSFGAWLLRRNAAALGLDPKFTIYDEDDMVSLLKSLFPERERRELGRWAFLIGRAKDFARGPEGPLSDISSDPQFAKIYGAYEEKLRLIGNVDFGDLILRSVELLRDNEEIRSRIHDRFRVIMVDEYQDSNVAQHLLLRSLAGPSAYVCVVGDDDQSIYRFRGAEIRNIQEFPEIFPGADIIRLEQNYRSTGRILAAAQAVVENNSGRLGKKLWTDNPEGFLPGLVACDDQDAEAKFCLSLLRKAPESQTAILYRTNAQSRVFESLFLKAKVPYRIVGTVRFYEREEIKDVLAFLKFMANPRDEVSFRRIVNKPSRGLGEASVEKILACRGEDFLIPAALEGAGGSLSGKAASALKDFSLLYADFLHELEEKPLADFTDCVIRESGLEEYHKAQDEVAGKQKVQNLGELVNAASLYPPGSAGLAEFLEGIELDSAGVQEAAAEPGSYAGNPVTLITMHNTKGLEFDRVIITGMEEGLFPRSGDEEEDELEEERRLFYVAITRARREVYFTFCANRRIHGQLKSFPPSRFLEELPEEIRSSARSRRGAPGAGRASGTSPLGGFHPGTTVYHENYGQGMVWKSKIRGGEQVVTVRFDTGAVLEFLPRYERRLERAYGDGL
jgi:DNA helicase-2/ATP-dependent DNA helicase PcrA